MATCEFYILEEDVMGIAFGGWVCIVDIYGIVYQNLFDFDFLDIVALRYSALMNIINQIQWPNEKIYASQRFICLFHIILLVVTNS